MSRILVRFFITGQLLLAAALLQRDAVQAGVIAGAVHNWDANTDMDADDIWEDTGTLANRDWTLIGSMGPQGAPHRVAVVSPTSITHAYRFDGLDDSGGTGAENRTGNHDTSFEVWFKPSAFPVDNARPVFEHGNAPRGVTLGLSGDQLLFVYAVAPPGGIGLDSAVLTFDLDANNDGIDNPDFIQAIGVIDDTNNQVRFYVDGGNEQVMNVGSDNDFTSNDGLGLARNRGQGGGGQSATALDWDGGFIGQVAILREYRSALGLAEARQNYLAIAIPEPSTACLALVGVMGVLMVRCKCGARCIRNHRDS